MKKPALLALALCFAAVIPASGASLVVAKKTSFACRDLELLMTIAVEGADDQVRGMKSVFLAITDGQCRAVSQGDRLVMEKRIGTIATCVARPSDARCWWVPGADVF